MNALNQSATPLHYILAALSMLFMGGATWRYCQNVLADEKSPDRRQMIRWLHDGQLHRWTKPSTWIENQPTHPK